MRHPIRSLFTRRPGLRDREAARGFTLLEALVVLALLGILVGMAAPAMSDLRLKHQLQSQAEGFLDSLVLARTESLRRQQRISLCALASGGGCDADGQWQQGWLVFVDGNDNGLMDSGETLIEAHAALPSGMSLGATSTVKNYFSYGPDGRSATANGGFMAGTWRFCRVSSSLGWQVVSNALGKPRIEKYTAQECP